MPHLVMRERVQMATSFASSANDEGILELDLNHEGILELDFFGGHQGGGDNP